VNRKLSLDVFEKYLLERNYRPSTSYDYAKTRVPKICEKEEISVEKLADNIRHYVEKYGVGGSEQEFGKKSHSSYICALKRFEEFIGSKI